MPSRRPLHAGIRLAVTCLVLAIGLRSWLVMGLIEPVTVAGSSMAPTLRGVYVTPQCPDCGHRFSVGAEFAASAATVACPQCTQTSVPLAALRLRHGDRLWIDRTTLSWRAPQRWELIVARNPENGAELCVKRVVGLPGETIAVRDGNVLAGGAMLVKSIEQQRRSRQIVHRENARSRRWQAEATAAWQCSGGVWQYNGALGHGRRANRQQLAGREANLEQQSTASRGTIDWLDYQHPHHQPLTDDVTYNAGLTRQLQLVDEFMLAAELSIEGEGTLALRLNDGSVESQVRLQLPGGEMVVRLSGRPASTARLSTASLHRLAEGKALLEFSNFDRQLLLAIDGQVELRRPWPRTERAGTDRPVSIGAQGIAAGVDNLRLYRDLYHLTQAVGVRPPRAGDWQLGADEYFLLGDNSPVSLDSRRWGPLPRRLMVGKPLGNR